jgi:hypothetical protein
MPEAAASLLVRDGKARVGVISSSAHTGAVVRLEPVARWQVEGTVAEPRP